MSAPRRIIIGANGSPSSIRALRYAEDLARFSAATLVPVLAWTPPGGDMAERRAPSAQLRRLGSPAGLRGWAFRHRELTLDRAMREWGRAAV